jgi:hypothetical protein
MPEGRCRDSAFLLVFLKMIDGMTYPQVVLSNWLLFALG